jgi:hypothetical protein
LKEVFEEYSALFHKDSPNFLLKGSTIFAGKESTHVWQKLRKDPFWFNTLLLRKHEFEHFFEKEFEEELKPKKSKKYISRSQREDHFFNMYVGIVDAMCLTLYTYTPSSTSTSVDLYTGWTRSSRVSPPSKAIWST